jgi:hypothetical protein
VPDANDETSETSKTCQRVDLRLAAVHTVVMAASLTHESSPTAVVTISFVAVSFAAVSFESVMKSDYGNQCGLLRCSTRVEMIEFPKVVLWVDVRLHGVSHWKPQYAVRSESDGDMPHNIAASRAIHKHLNHDLQILSR